MAWMKSLGVDHPTVFLSDSQNVLTAPTDKSNERWDTKPAIDFVDSSITIKDTLNEFVHCSLDFVMPQSFDRSLHWIEFDESLSSNRDL